MSRRYQIRTPPTSPPRPGPSNAPTPSGVGPRNDLERMMLSQGIIQTPTSDAELDKWFLDTGYSRDQLPLLRKVYDERANKLAAVSVSGGRIHVIGEKPETSGATFSIYRIPQTSLALRLFDGGMERYDHYCLDFYDLDSEKPINTPPGYKIIPGSLGPLTQRSLDKQEGIGSWETAFHVPRDELQPGEEKFGVPEGSYWCLVYRNTPVIQFAVPTRPRTEPAGFLRPTPYQPRRL